MEEFVILLIPAFLSVLLVRALLLPIRAVWKFLLHAAGGFVCLWLLNAISVYTGIAFPINAVTVLTAGFFGLPGIGLMAVLAVI